MHLVAAAPGQHDQRGEEEDDRGDAAGDSQIVREPAGVRSASGSGTERRSETSLGVAPLWLDANPLCDCGVITEQYVRADRD